MKSTSSASGTRCDTAALIAHAGIGSTCGSGHPATVLAALAEAAGLIREQAASCADCELAPPALCGDHAEALARAEDYDRLAGLLKGQR
jgi:hypothetical protein